MSLEPEVKLAFGIEAAREAHTETLAEQDRATK